MPSIRDRVIAVVTQWSGLAAFGTNEALETIWGRSASANALPFKPQAVSDLIQKLDSEFDSPNPDTRDLSTWSPNQFAPPAGIKSVDDLVTGVFVMPPDGVVARFTSAVMRDTGMRNAIAEAVTKKMAAQGLVVKKGTMGKPKPKKAGKKNGGGK